MAIILPGVIDTLLCDTRGEIEYLLLTYTDSSTVKVPVKNYSKFTFAGDTHFEIYFDEIPLFWILGSEKTILSAVIFGLNTQSIADVTSALLTAADSIDPEISAIAFSWVVSSVDVGVIFA